LQRTVKVLETNHDSKKSSPDSTSSRDEIEIKNVGNGVQHVGNTEQDRRYANRDVYDGVAINAKVNSASGNIGTLASATIAAWIRDA